MEDLKNKLKEYVTTHSSYYYHKMKAYEHIGKEARKNWEEAFKENELALELNKIIRNDEVLSTLIHYQSCGNFYQHAHNGFEHKDDMRGEYGEFYEGINVKAIEKVYDLLEKGFL